MSNNNEANKREKAKSDYLNSGGPITRVVRKQVVKTVEKRLRDLNKDK